MKQACVTTGPRAPRWIRAALAAVLASGPVWASEEVAEPAAEPGQPAASVFLLADPQLHNVHAAQIKQMLLPANWFSKVAIRPPELNLLAPLVLRHTLRQRGPLGAGEAPTVLLGDATNIGCSGEWEDFVAEMNAGAGPLWLMAHGNHDTYLMGTTNVFVPTEASWVPDGEMAGADLPVDESFFKPRDVPALRSRSPWNLGGLWKKNWPDACARPAAAGGQPGSPMNKPRWMARYAALLAPHGLEWFRTGGDADSGIRISSRTAASSRLAGIDYRLVGRWYPPKPGYKRRAFDYTRSSASYLVQSFDLGSGRRMVLIDTSTCTHAPLTLDGNAGSNACLGSEQLQDIGEELARARAAGQRLVLGAHYPLEALAGEEQSRLLALMAEADPKGWTFVSGHSHDAISMRWYAGGVDVNIGSTTDWPMEAHLLRFTEGLPVVASTSLSDTVAAIELSYIAPARSELCRHHPMAMALKDLDLSRPVSTTLYEPPTAKDCDLLQERWATSSAELEAARAEIARRFDQDPAYARRVLAIAAGASLREYHTPHLGSLIK